jgi:hypothetical protein
LIILHPKATHKRNLSESTAMVFAQKATENRGTANRVNRNMLVYLAADDDRMAELDIAVRDYLGWSDVLAKQEDLDLTQNQKNQAIEKQRQAGETAAARLLGTYQWVLVPEGQPITITATKAEGQATSLAERVSKRLSSDGALSAEQAAAAIRHVLNTTAKPLWVPGHLTVGDLWRLYATYAYMPRLRDRSVLIAGLRNPPLLWEHDGFALADGYDADAKRYRGLVLPSDDSFQINITDTTLVVVNDEILAHLASSPNVRLRVTIEIEATMDAGFDESKIRTISENADVLRFDESGFEES